MFVIMYVARNQFNPCYNDRRCPTFPLFKVFSIGDFEPMCGVLQMRSHFFSAIHDDGAPFRLVHISERISIPHHATLMQQSSAFLSILRRIFAHLCAFLRAQKVYCRCSSVLYVRSCFRMWVQLQLRVWMCTQNVFHSHIFRSSFALLLL